MKPAAACLTCLFSVLLAAPAQANHISGATYTGTHSAGGTVEFQVSSDGARITGYKFTGLPCTSTSNCTTVDIGPVSGGPPITNHAFDSRTASDDFSGSFPGAQSAQGSYRYHSPTLGTQAVTWNATTTAQPGPGPGPTPGPAPAPSLTTTEGDDNVVGTAGDDLLCGEGGSDTISGLDGDDVIFGDFCEDTEDLFKPLVATAAARRRDVLLGGRGDDDLYGGRGDNTMMGESGDDVLIAQEGNDVLNGGAGNDVLDGFAGRNSYSGGSGNDTIIATNRRRETVTCGSGRDTVVADRGDAVRGCERVRRGRR